MFGIILLLFYAFAIISYTIITNIFRTYITTTTKSIKITININNLNNLNKYYQ